MPYVKIIVISILFATFSFAQSAYSEFPNEEPIIASDIIVPDCYKKDTPQVEIVEEYSEKAEEYSTNKDKNPFDDITVQEEDLQQTETLIEEQKESYLENTQEIISSSDDTDYTSNSLQKNQQDIQGHFRLTEGVKSFGESINKKIESGYLVIEKLDENNYGFYYTVKVETFSPDNYFGIFRYKDGKFYQRVIQNEGSLTTEDLENIKIVTGDNKLELRVNTQNGGRIIVWELDSYGKEPDSKELKRSLDDAKRSYLQVYKQKFSQLN